VYDPNQNPIFVTQPEGNSVATVYDEGGLVFTVTRGFGTIFASTTTRHSDPNGNMTSFVDAFKNNAAKNPTVTHGDVTQTDYDGVGRVLRVQSPIFFNSAGTASVRNEMQYGYDGASNAIRTTQIDRSPSPGVAAQTFLGDAVFDAVSRVIRKSDSMNATT